ncbi:outer membrane lipoprotein chaperone LolA [Glaciecola sp. MH2013]|uniref:outer membrane lipoprotein chaperone LolA n=1 Tax=Glaciecola sp. MH2013 TaxID=2785524 RepID=UPI00189FAD48|nr:outer membrane lipoprotein chaperone LolA [Glaciecola sp. MH2013]MBF7072852.1 outer membrane lipoprotein chaperone LolA [Glaciecola sp. MH2013]
MNKHDQTSPSAVLRAMISTCLLTAMLYQAGTFAAQSPDNLGPNSNKVSAVNNVDTKLISSPDKEELRQVLSQLTSFEAVFSQSISDESGEELQSSSGRLLLLAPNKLRWETSYPDETVLIADGEAIWNIDPFVEQVTVISQSSMTANNPLMLLINDTDEQWNAITVNKRKGSYELFTSDETASIRQLNIKFENGLLTELTSIDNQQQKSLLVFSDIKQNTDVQKSSFEFSVPPTFIVDDQRPQN